MGVGQDAPHCMTRIIWSSYYAIWFVYGYDGHLLGAIAVSMATSRSHRLGCRLCHRSFHAQYTPSCGRHTGVLDRPLRSGAVNPTPAYRHFGRREYLSPSRRRRENAATVDIISGGRLICGLGAAWQRNEHMAYGISTR